MLQRIQSVWLLLASVCSFLTIKFPFYSGTNSKGEASYQLVATENIYLLVLTIAIAVVLLITIFLYKNRVLQLRLCVLAILLEAVTLFLYYRELKTFTVGTYSLTALLHSFIILFIVLAARSINKDEKLIKSTDRLR